MLNIFKKNKTKHRIVWEMHKSIRYLYLAAAPMFALPTSTSRVKLLKDQSGGWEASEHPSESPASRGDNQGLNKRVYEIRSSREQVSSEPLFPFSFNKETREHQTKLAAGRFKIKQIKGSSSSYNVYLSCKTHCHGPSGSQEFTQTQGRLDKFMQEKFIKCYLSLFPR